MSTATMRFTGSEREKFYAAASDGFVMRSIQSCGLSPHRGLERAKAMRDFDAVRRCQNLVNVFDRPTPGHEDFRNVTLAELARMFVEQSGEQFPPGMSKAQTIQRAIGMGNFLDAGRFMQRDGSYNTTGSFPNLMLDAANKTLLMAYDEAAFTYTQWVRQAPSAPDFKELNRIRFGEMPDPEVIAENAPYPEKQVSDQSESYHVEKYGEMFSISLEAIINDDLDAFSKIPQRQGMAMRRKINKVVYEILTANPTMSDGIALFHATEHGANLDATALSVAALGVGFGVMGTQGGLSAGTVLGIRPMFLIVPDALAPTAFEITASMANPAGNNSGVANMYGPTGPRPLIPIEEGQLDASSTTAWYLAANSAQIDTIEVTFLQGEEAPVLERQDAFLTDGVKFKIRQSWAAKAIDFKGLYKGNS